MTTTRTAAHAHRLSRDQSVAALLVGAVVILLGFASGLGLDPTPSTAPAAQPIPSTSAPAAPVSATAAAPVASTTPGVAYVAVPAPPAAPVVIAPVSSESTAPQFPTPAPVRPSGRGAGGGPTSSPAGPPAPSSTSPTTPPPSCSPGLLTSLLGALLPDPTDASGGLLGLGSLLPTIDQVTAATQLLTGGGPGLLGQVTGLLALPSVLPSGRTSTGLAASCTGEAQQALKLIAAGQDVPTAVRAAGR